MKSHIDTGRLAIADDRDVVTMNVRVYVKWSNDRLRAVGFRRIAPIQFTQATTITTRRRSTSTSSSSCRRHRRRRCRCDSIFPRFLLASHPFFLLQKTSAPRRVQREDVSTPFSAVVLFHLQFHRRSSYQAICRPVSNVDEVTFLRYIKFSCQRDNIFRIIAY